MIPKFYALILLFCLQIQSSEQLVNKRRIGLPEISVSALPTVSKRPDFGYVWRKHRVNYPYDSEKPYRFCYVLVKVIVRD